MKKLLFVFVLFVYFVPLSIAQALLFNPVNESSNDAALVNFIVPVVIFMLLVCAAIVANIIAAFISFIRSNCLSFKAVMIFKLSLIPFYVINFVIWLIGSMVFHIALFVWTFLPIVIAYTYFTIYGTSAHIIARLLYLRRNNIITTKQFVIHFILQIMFVLDIIDSIYLTVKYKGKQEQLL